MTKEDLIQEHGMVDKLMSVGKAQSHADLSEQYAKQQCIAFAEWIEEYWIYLQSGIYRQIASNEPATLTIEELYQLFLTDNLNKHRV